MQPDKAPNMLERTKIVTYRWWHHENHNIKPEHVEALEEHAEERIAEMMGQGYVSGELYLEIPFADREASAFTHWVDLPNDSENYVSYTGWWEVTTPE